MRNTITTGTKRTDNRAASRWHDPLPPLLPPRLSLVSFSLFRPGGWWLIKVQNRTFSKKRSLQKISLRFFWWNSIFYIVNTDENVIKIKFPHRLAPHRRWFEVGVAREEGGIHVVVALCCVQHSDKSSCCSRGRIRRVYEDMDFHGAPIGHRKHTLNFIHNVQIISIMYFQFYRLLQF